MKILKLLLLCSNYNITPEDIYFHGEHNVVYLDLSAEDLLKLPHDENGQPSFENCEEGFENTFYEMYGLSIIEGCWGAFT